MKLLLILFMSCACYVSAQEKRYCNSIFGTKLYSKPAVSSRLMDSIPFGDSVEFKSVHKKIDVISSKSGFKLKDNWIEVNYKNQKGYVFGADVSVRRVEASLFEKDPGYLGKLIESRMLDMGWFWNYSSGYYMQKYGDGCEDDEIVLRAYSLNEVYQILMQSYSDFARTEFPIYNGQEETKFNFSGVGATIVISLEPLPQGQFRITSYACD